MLDDNDCSDIIIIIALPTTAMAKDGEKELNEDSEVWNVNLSEDTTEYIDTTGVQPYSDGYYYWKVTSKSVISKPYGGWRYGSSGRGPATLAFTNSSTYSRSVTNTISGSYTSVSTIASSLGVTIGKAKTYSALYSVDIPKGKKYQIKYRPQFKRYKVVQTQYYRIDGHDSKTGSSKTCYVNVFSNWDYSWRSI